MSLASTKSHSRRNLCKDLFLDNRREVAPEAKILPGTLNAIENLGYRLVPVPGAVSSCLGGGIAAAVFLVEDKSGQQFAIKIFLEGGGSLHFLKNEYDILTMPDFPRKTVGPICYPSFAEVTFGGKEAQPFLVLEYIPGKEIDDYVRACKLSVPQTIKLIEELCHGVQEIHDRTHWAHCDIYECNVKVTDEGKVRLLDFEAAAPIARRNRSNHRRGNDSCSPQEVQASRKRADDKGDIYNIAALTYRLLLDDKLPEIPGDSGDPALINACLRRLRERRIPNTLAKTIVRGLGKRDDDHDSDENNGTEMRYRRASEFADALEDWRVHRPRRIVYWRRVLALVVLISVCFGGYAMLAARVRQNSATQAYRQLQREVSESPNATRDVVQRMATQAARENEIGRPDRANSLLRAAIEVAKLLDKKMKVGETLNTAPWVEESSVIVLQRDAIASDYEELAVRLEKGQPDGVSDALDNLQLRLFKLLATNEDARTAYDAGAKFDALTDHLPLDKQTQQAIAHGKSAFSEGRFQEAKLHFRQAREQIGQRFGEQPVAVSDPAEPTDQTWETWTNSIGMEFVKILPAKYIMGSDLAGGDACPHDVEITRPLFVCRQEVTQQPYLRILPSHQQRHPGLGGLPVVNLSWFDAVYWIELLNKHEGREATYQLTEPVINDDSITFAKVVINEPLRNAGYRLLTEAEWEYVARAGTSTEWPFPDGARRLNEYALYAGNSGNMRGLAEQKTPNAFGLYGMYGGVAEWCEDWYADNYYRSSPIHNPRGPEAPVRPARVVRGGSFHSQLEKIRPSARDGVYPATSLLTIGFRIVRVLSMAEHTSTTQDEVRK